MPTSGSTSVPRADSIEVPEPRQVVTPKSGTQQIHHSLAALQGVVDRHAEQRRGIPLGNWRWTVRQHLAPVRDALLLEGAYPQDWLSARRGSAIRERNSLLSRIGEISPRILNHPDVAGLAGELTRLVGDVRRHLQRLNDIAYDEVEMELGGSE